MLKKLLLVVTTPIFFISPKTAITIWRKTGIAKGTIWEE